MTRLLHVADLHQGLVPKDDPTDPGTGLPSSLVSVARCWHRACEIAEDRRVDLVVIAGDVFHGRNPDAASLNLFEAGLRRLEGAGIPVVLIAGNHDGARVPGQQSVLEIFHDPPSVYVSVRPEILDVDGLRLATLPWVSRQGLMANRPGISRQDAEHAVVDGLCAVVGQLRAEGADVLTGHWPVQGAVLGNERDISIVPEPVIPSAELEGPWRYVAMGHIHKAQALAQGFGAYSGSIDRMNFGEEDEEKVAFEVDLDLGVSGAHELPARRFLTLSATDQEWDPALWPEAIIRVQDCDPAAASEIRRALLAGGAQLVRIQPRVEREHRPRAETVTEALSETEALEEFLRLRGVVEEERPALRDMAKQLMEPTE